MSDHKLQSVRGTKDLYGVEIKKFNHIIAIAKQQAANYFFDELQTPIFEFSEIFERNLGQDSDILTKEIYKFKDRSENYLTLRPEFTASIVRAFASNGDLHQILPQKLFSYGPVFRYDRPQKGRQRQFNQINYEIFGSNNSFCDAELILLASSILQELNIADQLILKINHLGCEKTKNDFEQSLKEYFNKFKNDLSPDSQQRLNSNPLRILDSKSQEDIALFGDAPQIANFYSAEARQNFDKILQILDKFAINYEIEQNLVRGLDYYTGLVFEFVNNHDGAQNTVLAGGRYDNLVEKMSGKPVPAIGFAAGIERLAMMLPESQNQDKKTISVNYISDGEKNFAFEVVKSLRNADLSAEFYYEANFKKQMKKSSQNNCKFVIIIGEDEVKSKIVTVKDLDLGQESKVAIADLTSHLKSKF